MDNNNSKILYAGFDEGLYKTTDGGKNWEALASGLIAGVNSLYIDKQDPKIIYAATENGLFRSHDSGGNYTHLAPPFMAG